ncbi:hypothetical protein SLS62_005800 [Diatrype stigma]|uniref:Ubiquitin carrier protein n=1 Tax=Diatrype stigma TaxID=117547 RepID=A0AAN9UP40_9PEZI
MPPSLVASILERAPSVAIESLARRAEESDDISTIQRVFENLPDDLIWWLALAALNCLVFVPPIIFLSYSVNSLWPVLSILEDDAPPTYERIALQDRDGDKEDEGGEKPEAALLADEAGGGGSGSGSSLLSLEYSPAVTADLRLLNRMLYSIGGWPSLLRGLRPHMFFNLSVAVLTFVMTCIPYLPKVLGIAVAPLAVVQLYTAWVHVAISAPSPKPFFRRFPRFATAARATALPTATMWLAVGIAQELPLCLLGWLHVKTWDPTGYDVVQVPYFDGFLTDFLKLLALFAAWALPTLLLVIPAHAVLTRVQASLLPAGERTVVPFDRTFQGQREPGGEKGERPIGMVQAWRSFSRASWLRLYVLYAKVFFITLGASIFMGAAVGIQIIIVWSNIKKGNGNGNNSNSNTTSSSGD